MILKNATEVFVMNYKNGFSPKVQEKFETLPPFIQESIMQSGMKIENLKQLDEMAEKITKKRN